MKNRIFVSLVIGVATIVGLLVWQASTNHVSTVLLPSELAAEPSSVRLRLRVAGRVAENSIDYQVSPAALLRFNIHDPTQKEPTIAVVYRGLRPDMFAAGRDVILDGEWQSGVLLANKLMTQCPSKYEPPDPNTYKKNDN